MTPPRAHPSLTVWRLLDGRAGHRSQIEGLCAALARRVALDCHDLAVAGPGRELRRLGLPPSTEGLPPPDLILAAGHRTHLPALAARRVRGGRIVVLMKPSLPLRWFDLCLIPEHDRPPAADHVIATRGVLHDVRPGEAPDPRLGLMLIGGPSRHHDWDGEALAAQVRAIVSRQPELRFVIADSRRTPTGFLETLRALPGVETLHHRDCPPGEPRRRMARAGQIWVGEDSVSMVYEALGTGVPVGLLEMPARRRGRVSQGIEALVRAGWATPFSRWRQTLPPPPRPLLEADRCAAEILRRWPPR